MKLIGERFARTLWILGLLISALIVANVFFDQPTEFYVTEREPQTAISAHYLAKEGLNPLAYVTPVLGAPWAIPFEFPIYQVAVALIDNPYVSFATTGRLLSVVFLLLSIAVARKILDVTGASSAQIDTFTVLAVTSPILVTYSFSFTIESTAVLCSLVYLCSFAQLMKTDRRLWLFAALVAGVLAAAVKVTTWAVFAAVIALIALWSTWTEFRRRTVSTSRVFESLGILLVPLAAALLWTYHADQVKGANPFGRALTSGALPAWTYGTWAQKLSVIDWSVFLGRSCVLILGVVGVVIPLLLFQGRADREGDPYQQRLGGIFAVGFLVGPVVFTNLYFEHDYYVVGTSFLLLFAIAIASGSAGLSRVSLAVIVAGNLLTSWVYLEMKQANYDDPLNRHIVQAVRGLPTDTSLIVFGAYLDSYIPYYSEKRALQSRVSDFDDPVFQEALQGMREQNVAAVITKGEQYAGIARETAASLGLNFRRELAPGIVLHGRSSFRSLYSIRRFDVKREIDRRVGPFIGQFQPDGARVLMSVELTDGPAVLVSARGNLYLFDRHNGFQVVHRRWSSGLVDAPALKIGEE
ncbi:MAG: hypothetical protein GY906_12325 [bacterium]|nr:hypothetical protein [bacterium]